jgi:hypothetical protein
MDHAAYCSTSVWNRYLLSNHVNSVSWFALSESPFSVEVIGRWLDLNDFLHKTIRSPLCCCYYWGFLRVSETTEFYCISTQFIVRENFIPKTLYRKWAPELEHISLISVTFIWHIFSDVQENNNVCVMCHIIFLLSHMSMKILNRSATCSAVYLQSHRSLNNRPTLVSEINKHQNWKAW